MLRMVWRYIGAEESGIIGLYGMGGVGKTTLLNQINNKLCNETPQFDVVIWVVVSKNPNPMKIQEDIGKRIGFRDETWKRKCKTDKAEDIFSVLKKKTFMLLLDDIWEGLDLTEVGVPPPNKENKSKIVFTTRFEHVCNSMDAKQMIKVKCLAWKEAWDLFQQKVGEKIINSHPEITELAKAVARECDGLPLALITIGQVMASKKTHQEWKHALDTLQKYAAGFSGMEEKVFGRLKFSYDNLPSDANRSCLLYCSLFPEDCVIYKEKLINYWICEGFLDGFDGLNGGRNLGHDIIGTLIHACLLEEEDSNNVKMHDVIRDMALWIARQFGTVKGNVLVQAGARLEKAPEVEEWKGVERISLMDNCIQELGETPICPNLLTLFLSNNYLRMITPGFFQYMCNLRVLDLSWNYYLDELPVEISELVSLQYLNVGSTSIKEFPIEFKKLVELKVLGLFFTRRLDKIHWGVLSGFKKLQVLDVCSCGSTKYLSMEENVLCDQDKSLVDEVECLKDLIHLGITIKTTFAFQRLLSSPKFECCTNELALHLLRGLKDLDMSCLENMRGLAVLRIKDCMDLENLRIKRVGEGMEISEIRRLPRFQSLNLVIIEKCPMLKELTLLCFAPNVSELRIIDCRNMEEVICGRWGEAIEEGRHLNQFAKLKYVDLKNLPQLKRIYSNALPFPCLVSLRVKNCPNLKKLPLNSDSANGGKALIRGQEDWWNDLEWEDEATRDAFLPSFESLNY